MTCPVTNPGPEINDISQLLDAVAGFVRAAIEVAASHAEQPAALA
jgi:hypothetical protein